MAATNSGSQVQINPPFGYKDVVPLLKTHRVRLARPDEVPEFARALNAIPVSFTEFAPAARDYPIVFTSGDRGKSFAKWKDMQRLLERKAGRRA